MAEPARKFDDSDDHLQLSAVERAQRSWGMPTGQSDPEASAGDTAASDERVALDRAQDRWGEAGVVDGGKDKKNDDSSSNSDDSLYNPDGDKKRRGWRPTKKQGITGGIIGLLVGGGFGALSIISGPLQLVHLSEILGKQSWFSEKVVATRYSHHHRYAKSGQVGETRVGIFGSRLHARTTSQLAAIGITYDTSTRTGQPARLVIDPSINPDLRSGTIAEVARYLDLPENNLVSVDGKIEVDTRHMTNKQLGRLDRTSVSKLANGKVLSGMKFRNLRQFHGIPSMFHPIRRAEARLERAIDNAIGRMRSLREVKEEIAEKRKSSRIKQRAIEARTRINNRLGSFKGAVSATIVAQDFVCAVKAVSDAIPIVNYGYVVAPAMVEAITFRSVGEQIKHGEDYYMEQLGAQLADTRDEQGRPLWSGEALDALAKGGSGTGVPIDPDLAQAFSPRVTKSVIENALPISTGGVAGAIEGAACSVPGLIVGGAAGIALTVLSGGAWSAGRIAATASSSVLASAAMIFASDKAIDYFTLDPIDIIKGPQGGNLLAYGMRAAENSSGRVGGVVIPESEERTAYAEYIRETRDEFRNSGVFARYADVYNYQSFASILIRSSSPNISNSLQSFIGNVFNLSSLVSSLGSLLTPLVHADGVPYDWGFPMYGVPESLLNNPAYEDPYQNANIVGAELTSAYNDMITKKDISRFPNYVSRIKNCFGSDLLNGAEGWDIKVVDDVNPAEENYVKANCGGINNEMWARIMLFVYDTNLLKSVDCYGGESQSCTELGFGAQRANIDTSGNLEGVQCPENLEAHPTKPGYFKWPDAPNGEYISWAQDSKRWGSKQAICATYSVALEYHRQMNGESVLRVGNFNTPYKDPSTTHRWGVAVDISATGPNQNGTGIQAASHVSASKGTYSKEATILLGKLWADTGVLKNIWWCPPAGDTSIQEITDYAKDKGLLAGSIKCVAGHSDHFHVDIVDEYRQEIYP